MNKTIIAVDAGVSGGIALTDGSCAIALPLSNAGAVRDLIEKSGGAGCVAYMEQVGGYIGKEQPGSRMFTFGDSFGFMRGLLFMAHFPLRLVTPQKWIRAVLPGSLGLEYNDRKRALKQYAQSRYPALDVTLATSDALALLDYATRNEAGEFGATRAAVFIPSASDYAADARAAVKWAKGLKYVVPKRGGKEYLALVNYWRKEIKKPAP